MAEYFFVGELILQRSYQTTPNHDHAEMKLDYWPERGG